MWRTWSDSACPCSAMSLDSPAATLARSRHVACNVVAYPCSGDGGHNDGDDSQRQTATARRSWPQDHAVLVARRRVRARGWCSITRVRADPAEELPVVRGAVLSGAHSLEPALQPRGADPAQ